MTVWMSGKDNCFDNAMVEMVFKTNKNELVWRTISKAVQPLSQPLADTQQRPIQFPLGDIPHSDINCQHRSRPKPPS